MDNKCPDTNYISNQEESSRTVGRKKPWIFLCVFLALIILFVFIVLAITSYSKTILPNVIIMDTDVGGYTKENLYSLLETELSTIFTNMDLTFSDPHFERRVRVCDIGIEIDIESMVNRAYAVGHEGNLFNRIASIIKLKRNSYSIDIIPSGDSQKFKTFLDEICENTFSEIIPSNIIVLEDQVILCTPVAGREADREKLQNLIFNALIKQEEAIIPIPIIERQPQALDIDSTLLALNRPPKNAEFVRTSRTTYEIYPHQNGLSLDRASLMEIFSYLEVRDTNDYERIILPVKFITPDITQDQLEALTFRDTLATSTTYFTTKTQNNYNRGINIGIASNSIDGTILMPGETFSFNDIVGPRTSQKGYRSAHIYADGQIKNGIGGGICQVSTTLYNAVLKSNLKVNERHNHVFTVSYVPLGHDAAVSYGYCDLVFKNTTSYPLQINANVDPAGSVTFSISCTNDYPDLRVELATKTISSTPSTVIYENTNTLPEGIEKVAESGMNGYIVDTYIKIYNKDELIKEEKLHRSIYQMYPRRILRGHAATFENIE